MSEEQLLKNLREALPSLTTLLEKVSDEWGYEDGIYRFYHHSYKVYGLQYYTKQIVTVLQALLPDQALNADFLAIVAEGTNKKFSYEDNKHWLVATRPIVEAFLHAKFFLEMAIKFANLESTPSMLPSGWAAFLYLFNLR